MLIWSAGRFFGDLQLVFLFCLFESYSHLCFTDKKADCTITMADTDLLALMTGKMNPQTVSVT